MDDLWPYFTKNSLMIWYQVFILLRLTLIVQHKQIDQTRVASCKLRV